MGPLHSEDTGGRRTTRARTTPRPFIHARQLACFGQRGLPDARRGFGGRGALSAGDIANFRAALSPAIRHPAQPRQGVSWLALRRHGPDYASGGGLVLPFASGPPPLRARRQLV